MYLKGWGYAGEKLGEGTGLSKQEAGQKAAEDAMGNPLVAKLEGVKKASDEKNRREKEKEEQARGEVEKAEDAVKLAANEVEAAREKMVKAENKLRELTTKEQEEEEEEASE